MTVLAAYISHTPDVVRAMARSGLAGKKLAPVKSMDDVAALEVRTADLLKGISQIVAQIPSRRGHSDKTMFSPEQRARNIAMSYLAASSEARRGDLRTFDGHLVEMRSKMPATRDVTEAVDALNARRGLLNMAMFELEQLVGAVARSDVDAAEVHRARIGEIAGASIPAPERAMTTFEYLVQRSKSMG